MTYTDKLKNPRWQKKRLEILRRDDWTCKLCGDKETTLHVHHLSYSDNPWETADEDLISYCEHCHTVVEINKKVDLSIVKLKKVLCKNKNEAFYTILFYNAEMGYFIMMADYNQNDITNATFLFERDMKNITELIQYSMNVKEIC